MLLYETIRVVCV